MRASGRRPFGDYLLIQRGRRGMDLSDLSVAARISLPRLEALESGSASPELAELRRLARALGQPQEALFAKAGQWRRGAG